MTPYDQLMDAFEQNPARVEPLVLLALQPYAAGVLLLVAVVLGFTATMQLKQAGVAAAALYAVLSVVCAGSLGLGAVFLLDAVGVYV